MNNYIIHPIANIFPMMNQIEFEALKQDIQVNGLRESVYLFNGQIIDGRNRYKACIEVGVTPIVREFEGDESELLNFVLSLNLHRRHLTNSQKACLSVSVLPQIEAETKRNLSKKISAIRKGNIEDTAILQKPKQSSSQTAGSLFGISERYVNDAKKLLKESEQLFNLVKNGELTLQQAKRQLSNIEDTAILQKPEENKVTPILNKRDIKKVSELVSELGITESKAITYITKLKTNRKPVMYVNQQHSDIKELKFRLPEGIKIKLQDLAKQQNISASELLRQLLAKELMTI